MFTRVVNVASRARDDGAEDGTRDRS